jgi:3'-5' exoribonuclease
MLHYLDDLDSKMESMRAHFEREAGSEAAWTSYNPSLGRSLLNPAKFLDKDRDKDKKGDENGKERKPAPQASEETSSEDAPELPGLELGRLDLPEQERQPAAVTVAPRPDKI